jgi:hypothetical protein
MSVLFTAMLFLCGLLSLMYTNLKETNSTLAKLNSKLDEDVNELETKNAMLHSELISRDEERIIDVGRQIKWLDKHKEIETGSVLDDYRHNGKVYVVVIRLKDGKTQGAPISIPYEKLILS